MKKIIFCLLCLFLVACECKKEVSPGKCYQHKITGEKGLIINIRRGDSAVPNNKVMVGKTEPMDTCITYEKDYAGNNILSNCLEKVKLGGYTKEYYVSEVSVIQCTGITKEGTVQ